MKSTPKMELETITVKMDSLLQEGGTSARGAAIYRIFSIGSIHQRLLNRLWQRVRDPRILDLVNRM